MGTDGTTNFKQKIIPVSSAKFKESNHLTSPSSVNLQAHKLVVIWGYIFLVHDDSPKQVHLPSGTGTQRSVPQLIGPWLNSNPNWVSLILSPRELFIIFDIQKKLMCA